MRVHFTCWTLVTLLLSGCAVLGKQEERKRIDPDAVARITKGMPKEEVTAILGAPNEIIFSNKALDPLREHAYVYEHKTTKWTGILLVFINFGNADMKLDRVIAFFDDDGKVSHIGSTLNADDAAYGFPFGG
jgi:outer membrane protein assembly factor BamE (lipoprotein component of BamABCDE complex)